MHKLQAVVIEVGGEVSVGWGEVLFFQRSRAS
jgi:hypothetical protein